MTYAAEVLADSPTVYLKLDDTSGTAAVDSSGNSEAGIYFNSPTLSATHLITVGTAVTFAAGSTQSVGIVPSPASFFDCTGQFSIEFWLKTTQAKAENACYIGAADASSHNFFTVTQDTGTGAIVFNITDSGASGHVCTGTTPVNDGVVRHVVCTYNGSAMVIYLNGVVDKTTSLSFTPATQSPTIFVAQRRNAGSSTNFVTGTMDEVAYYKAVALSQARVTAHYNAGAGIVVVSSTKVPIDSFAYGSSVYRRDTAVQSTDAAVTALPALFIDGGGAKTATTSFVYHDSTLGRDRAIWAGDQVAITDNAYLAATAFFV